VNSSLIKPVHELAAKNMLWRATDGEPFDEPDEYWRTVRIISRLLAEGECVMLKRHEFGDTVAVTIRTRKKK